METQQDINDVIIDLAYSRGWDFYITRQGSEYVLHTTLISSYYNDKFLHTVRLLNGKSPDPVGRG